LAGKEGVSMRSRVDTRGRARASQALLTVVCVFGVFVSGCGDTAAVTIFVVEPAVVAAGETFVVRGSGFEWDYNAFTDSVVGEFVVELDDVAADDVEWIDVTRVSARAPIDFAPSTVDVTVTGPRGSASAEDALTVVEPLEN